MKLKSLLITAGIVFSGLAMASPESDVMLKLKKNFPDVAFTSVKATPSKGIYEVQIDKKVIYTDTAGQYFFPTMIEMKTKRDLGSERNEDLARINFASLPFQDAIKTVKGNGKRVMAVWSDPDCPYCVKLEKTLQDLSDVTIYTFPLPLDKLHPMAKQKAISAWCSSDPGATWSTMLLERVTPAEKNCDNPIERNQALAAKLNIYGTPALVFADGRILPGAADLNQINQYLNRKVN